MSVEGSQAESLRDMTREVEKLAFTLELLVPQSAYEVRVLSERVVGHMLGAARALEELAGPGHGGRDGPRAVAGGAPLDHGLPVRPLREEIAESVAGVERHGSVADLEHLGALVFRRRRELLAALSREDLYDDMLREASDLLSDALLEASATSVWGPAGVRLMDRITAALKGEGSAAAFTLEDEESVDV